MGSRCMSWKIERKNKQKLKKKNYVCVYMTNGQKISLEMLVCPSILFLKQNLLFLHCLHKVVQPASHVSVSADHVCLVARVLQKIASQCSFCDGARNQTQIIRPEHWHFSLMRHLPAPTFTVRITFILGMCILYTFLLWVI